MKPAFSFDPESHTYRVGDRRLPSVTEILSGLGIGRDWGFLGENREFYLARGRAVHACIQLHFQGADIDWDFEGAEHVRPRFEKFQGIASAMGMKPILSEVPLYSEIFSYAGTEDYFGPFGKDSLAIVDYKGDSTEPAHELQVDGGYRGLLVELASAGGLQGITPADILHCPAYIIPLGGTSGPIRLPDSEGANMDIFRGCAAAYNWRLRRYGDSR
jgi:hypothetical protein